MTQAIIDSELIDDHRLFLRTWSESPFLRIGNGIWYQALRARNRHRIYNLAAIIERHFHRNDTLDMRKTCR